MRKSKLQAVWFSINLFLFGLMIVALGSDVWEAYMFLFVASAIGQYLVLLKNKRAQRENN